VPYEWLFCNRWHKNFHLYFMKPFSKMMTKVIIILHFCYRHNSKPWNSPFESSQFSEFTIHYIQKVVQLNSRTFLSLQKVMSHPLAVTPCSLTLNPVSPTPGKHHLPTFCLYRLPILDISYKENHRIHGLCDWLLSHSMFSGFIPTAAWISTSFLLIAEQHSIARIYHILFIHSSTDGHLDCFHFLAIMNNGKYDIDV
jgi:hypothetical protein